MHNVNVGRHEEGVVVDLHLEVDDQMSLEEAHALATKLEREVHQDQPQVSAITTHIESRSGAVRSSTMLAADADELTRVIEDIVNTAPGAVEVHNIEIRRFDLSVESGGQRLPDLVVYLHCRFDGATPIGDVHQHCHSIEDRILVEVPHVRRVSVHAEPVKKKEKTDYAN